MNIKKLSIFFISLFLSITLWAQHQPQRADNLVFLLRQPAHVTQALKTIDQLQSGSIKTKLIKPGKVAIIICGEAITSFTGKDTNETVIEAARLGVSLYGCGLSLKKLNLKKEDLAPGMLYVENGFIKSFELQKAGYLSVEL